MSKIVESFNTSRQGCVLLKGEPLYKGILNLCLFQSCLQYMVKYCSDAGGSY